MKYLNSREAAPHFHPSPFNFQLFFFFSDIKNNRRCDSRDRHDGLVHIEPTKLRGIEAQEFKEESSYRVSDQIDQEQAALLQMDFFGAVDFPQTKANQQVIQ